MSSIKAMRPNPPINFSDSASSSGSSTLDVGARSTVRFGGVKKKPLNTKQPPLQTLLNTNKRLVSTNKKMLARMEDISRMWMERAPLTKGNLEAHNHLRNAEPHSTDLDGIKKPGAWHGSDADDSTVIEAGKHPEHVGDLKGKALKAHDPVLGDDHAAPMTDAAMRLKAAEFEHEAASMLQQMHDTNFKRNQQTFVQDIYKGEQSGVEKEIYNAKTHIQDLIIQNQNTEQQLGIKNVDKMEQAITAHGGEQAKINQQVTTFLNGASWQHFS